MDQNISSTYQKISVRDLLGLVRCIWDHTGISGVYQHLLHLHAVPVTLLQPHGLLM